MQLPHNLKKLSAFDIGLVGILLVLGLSFFFFFYRRAEYINIRVKVTEQDVLYAKTLPTSWYANRFEVGDVEKDALGRAITEITNVESFNTESNKKAVYLDLRVRAGYDTRTKRYTARGKNIMFGTPMRFNLGKVTFDGYVTEFPGSDQHVSINRYTITTLGRNVEPSLASSVKKGDSIYDSTGTLLAEIKEIRVTQSEQVTQTDAGNLLLRLNPIYKDIVLTVEVKTKTLNGETYIFDNLPLKIGDSLPLNFENSSLFPIITDFHPSE